MSLTLIEVCPACAEARRLHKRLLEICIDSAAVDCVVGEIECEECEEGYRLNADGKMIVAVVLDALDKRAAKSALEVE